ncbi:uncharacterized protein LOC130053726 [Ostrea edulis]|uniref:uncharacterized protein LOC130053726 n=1 Tax=Ostrea edulis TaxID=37623 RepID=UPI0024AFE42C|nr:uncharacterized protein LOC130053726 [Ostrea edulis]
MHDTVIWLKLDQILMPSLGDVYLACVYIPPSSSTFYQTYDCDVFSDLENHIVEYMSLGKVMLIGDTNARTSNSSDFILHDVLHNDVLRDLRELLFYGSDTQLQVRSNPDKVVNDLGNKLLSLCKSSGLRILNGRHHLGMDNDYTFVGPRGMSVVDYVITSPDVFPSIDQFIVSNFTMYSDHAPLHIRIKSGKHIIQNINSTVEVNQESSYFVWNQELHSQARSTLLENSQELMKCFEKYPCESQTSIDESVNSFTTRLADLMRSSFEVPRKSNKGGQRPDRVHDKPWFNRELKSKYNTYRVALNQFNHYKNKENHLNLIEAKKNYKHLEAKLRRQYLRKEGDLLEHLRKQKPKSILQAFSKKKAKKYSNRLRIVPHSF